MLSQNEHGVMTKWLRLPQSLRSFAMTIGKKYAGALDIDREIVGRKMLLIYNSTYIIIYL